MRIDLPVCGFQNCRYSFDCNCTAGKIENERCEYRLLRDLLESRDRITKFSNMEVEQICQKISELFSS